MFSDITNKYHLTMPSTSRVISTNNYRNISFLLDYIQETLDVDFYLLGVNGNSEYDTNIHILMKNTNLDLNIDAIDTYIMNNIVNTNVDIIDMPILEITKNKSTIVQFAHGDINIDVDYYQRGSNRGWTIYLLGTTLYGNRNISIDINDSMEKSEHNLIHLYYNEDEDNNPVNADNISNITLNGILNTGSTVTILSTGGSGLIYIGDTVTHQLKELNIYYYLKNNNYTDITIEVDRSNDNDDMNIIAASINIYFDFNLNTYTFDSYTINQFNDCNIKAHLLNVPASIAGNYTDPCFVIENQIGLTVGNIIANKYSMSGSSEK